jgi:hypothetical protein
MRRLARHLVTALTALSLALGVIACVLWARSWGNGGYGERWAAGVAGDRWELRSEGGGLALYKRDRNPWFFGGVSTGGQVVPRYNWTPVFGFPYWGAVVAATLAPVAWTFRHRRYRHRVTKGLCLACGYDLRASPERCPECGTPS